MDRHFGFYFVLTTGEAISRETVSREAVSREAVSREAVSRETIALTAASASLPCAAFEDDQITGRMIYRSGRFLHYIEGPRERVHSFLRRCWFSPCHGSCRILFEATVSQRLFSNWTKTWVRPSPALPSSDSLISLFEIVLCQRTTTIEEIQIILQRFAQESPEGELPPLEPITLGRPTDSNLF